MPAKKFIKKGKKTKGLGKSKSTTTYGMGGSKKKMYGAGGTPVSGTPGKPTPAELDAMKKEQLMRELSGPPPTDRLGNPVKFIPANPFNKMLGGSVINGKSLRGTRSYKR